MSRSYKKHCGSSFICYRSDKPWRKEWHSVMRTMERDMLRVQLHYPEKDYCYPVPREAGNIYDAPSDGGSHWMYSGFEHYYFEETHPLWSWVKTETLDRAAAWKVWITKWVGK